MELRKTAEKEFHNWVRAEDLRLSKSDYEYYTSNKKFYCITRRSRDFVNKWLLQRCPNKRALDYCCGEGTISIFLAKNGARAIGIDISEVSFRNAKKNAIREEVDKNALFFAMGAEAMEFEDNYFDIIICSGVLHHLNIEKAYLELARVLNPGGECICVEPLGYNPLIQLYRKRTPHLRTKWETEHILRKEDIEIAKNCFNKVEILSFFHLATIAAVPFRDLPGSTAMLSLLETVDNVLLRLPYLKWQAWQVVFALSQPNKNGG